MFGRYFISPGSLKLALLILLSVLFSELPGQYYNIRCRNVGIPEGLSDGHINDIIQDEFDYIWIATRRGLYRHDGLNVTNFPIAEDSSNLVYDKEIIDLGNAAGGGIWIVSQYGLTLFENGIFQNKQISVDQGLLINSSEIVNNQDWFFTNHGIYSYHSDEQAFDKIMFSPQTNFKYSFINDAEITTGLLDPDTRKLWICTANKGIYVKDLTSGVISAYWLKPGESQSANNIYINKIMMDSRGGIWFASPQGLWHKPINSTEVKRVDFPNTGYGNNEVFYVAQDKDGNIWCAVEDLGLIVLNHHGEVIERFDAEDNNSSGLSSGYINKIFIDDQGNMWIGHKETGIDYFNTQYSQKIFYYKNVIDVMGFLPITVKRVVPLDKDRILMVHESPDNPNISGLSIASSGYGTYFSRPSAIQKVSLNQTDLNFTELLRIKDQFAVSTYDNLYLIDSGQLNTKESNINIKPDTKAYKDYVMFHYLYNGTTLLLGQNLRIHNIPDNEERILIRDINLDRFLIDEHALMWGAASYSGLVIIDLEKKTDLAQFINDPLDDKSLSDNNFNCIFKDSDGSIWIGTQFGLNRIEQNIDSLLYSSPGSDFSEALKDLKFQRFKVRDGLSGNAIKSMLEDGQKRLWMSTDNGISVIDLADYSIYKLDHIDGIQDGSFYLGSSAQSEDGNMYFGGENGLNFFHPDSILFKIEPPSIHINELYLLGEKVKPGSLYRDQIVLEQMLEKTRYIELSNREKLVTFGFVAVDFEHPDEITYYHMLDGFDMDWIRSAVGNRASYTKLPAGTYTFRVKARTINNQWTEEASIILTINPPFWARWWFISLMSMAFFSLVLLYIRARLSSLKRQKEKLEEIVHQRTEELEQANAMKLKFFTNISHELRTPLTLILAPVEKLIRTGGGAPSLQRQHSIIYRNAKRLQELINQLLQFRKIETGNLQLKARPGDIVKFVIRLTEPFIEYSKNAGIRFIRDIQHDSITSWYDEDKLKKILTNLLSNAFKYTPKGGDVTLRVSSVAVSEDAENIHHDEVIRFDVIDTGIGIDGDHLEKIFDRFYEDEESNIKIEGTGIGLALTKSLVELHKGKISVRSEVEKGSSFTVVIPRGESYLEEHEKMLPDLAKKEYDPGNDHKVNDFSPEKYLPDHREYDASKETIMIVEDNIDLCFFIHNILCDDFNIEIAHNGQEALEILKTELQIDLIISDVMMPVMDGFSFCRHIKNDVHTSHIPVLMLSAKHGEESELEGLKCGADDYILKPFNEDILKFKLKNILFHRAKLKSKFARQITIEPSEITTTSRDEEFLRKAISVVEQNMSDSYFDIKTFASSMAVSPSTLLRKLKAISGDSSEKFIRSLRLKRSAQLLKNSQLQVTEICYEVGFSSQKHFSTTFKKYFGRSPSEYQKDMN
jgi:signal transduction histidine kinase/DNA-binding response OmpR family regulator/ligand-binding sensor domain-containing protein